MWQAPNPKHQEPNNIQNLNEQNLNWVIWTLGNWNLFGIWDLVIGI
jgi:hypothetical protein